MKNLKYYCILLTSNVIITIKQLAKIGKILNSKNRHPHASNIAILISIYFFFIFSHNIG